MAKLLANGWQLYSAYVETAPLRRRTLTILPNSPLRTFFFRDAPPLHTHTRASLLRAPLLNRIVGGLGCYAAGGGSACEPQSQLY